MGFECKTDKPENTQTPLMLLIPVLFPCHTELHSKSKDPLGTYSTGKIFSPYANEMLKMFFCFSEVLILLMQDAQTS